MSAMIAIDSMNALGQAIRRRRKKLGYTQEEMADDLGFSPRLVGEIERGRATVGFEKVLQYTKELGIDLFAVTRGE